MIVSPTSGNKGVALRDAVLRALDAGLATPEQLRVVILAPSDSLPKLRASRLSTDPELRALNPQLVYPGKEPEAVKALAREFVHDHAARLSAGGLDVWFSLELANYMVADATRALFEHRVDPIERPRLHAHAVSSAFGLLGYHAGRELLEASGEARVDRRPASLLVQHLATPDMVLSLRFGSVDESRLSSYTMDASTGMYVRVGVTTRGSRRSPTARAEVLDATFYTRRPVTSPGHESRSSAGSEGWGGRLRRLARGCAVARYPFLRARSTPRYRASRPTCGRCASGRRSWR
jgi:hypothetical protein